MEAGRSSRKVFRTVQEALSEEVTCKLGPEGQSSSEPGESLYKGLVWERAWGIERQPVWLEWPEQGVSGKEMKPEIGKTQITKDLQPMVRIWNLYLQFSGKP